MTLAVAIKASDGIIIAADSRGTIGDPRGLTAVNDTQQKLFQFGTCAVAISGAAEMTLSLLDALSSQRLSNPKDIDEAVASFTHAANIYDSWLTAVKEEHRPFIAVLLAGYRSAAPTIPMIYLLTSNTRFAPQLSGAYPMMVGVPQYAIYLSHRYYDPGINMDSAAALAEYLITETASQDPKVGGPVRIAKVTAAGYRPLTDSEVAALKKRNQRLNAKLKSFFRSGG
jgi:20S proteasome alpha/beta subunit